MSVCVGVLRPQLLPTLLQKIQSQNPLEQQRALRTLLLVVKSLCSKALPPSRRSLQQMTPVLFQYTQAIWNSRCDEFIRSLNAQAGAPLSPDSIRTMQGLLEMAILALKCLRQLFTFGVEKFDVSVEIAVSSTSLDFRSLL